MAINEKVSGIGKEAKRVDLNVSKQPIRYISGMSNMQQATGKEVYEQQRNAPMYNAETESEVIPITAFTQNKEESIFNGMDFGDGADSRVLPSIPIQKTNSLADTFKQISTFDPSGDSELIYRWLVDEGY